MEFVGFIVGIVGLLLAVVSLWQAWRSSIRSSQELQATATQLMGESRQLRTLINALGHHLEAAGVITAQWDAEDNLVWFVSGMMHAETARAYAAASPATISSSTVMHAETARAHASVSPASFVVSDPAEPIKDEGNKQE